MKQIVGANRKAIPMIEMALPIDSNGDYAFDENGDAVPGRHPVVFAVPRFDTLDREQIKAINKELRAIDDKTDADGEALTPQDKSLETLLIMLRPFVSEDVLRVVEMLKPLELDQVSQYWQEQSAVSLGELVASTNS